MVIKSTGVVYDNEEIANVMKAAQTFYNVEGAFTEQLREELCKFMDVKYCVLCNSGSSANLLAITALNLPQYSGVITTACGFPTTLNPIIQNNLLPVFADIDINTLNININSLLNMYKTSVGAIVVPHTLGNPCQIEKIVAFAKLHSLCVVEDNCDALGSKVNGKMTGTFGDVSTLSFYPAHHITTCEGGAVLTNNKNIYDRVLSLCNWGRDCTCKPGQDNSCGNRFKGKFGSLPYGYDHKYVYSNIGYNLKMTNLQAAIGCAQIKKLPEFIQLRQRNYKLLYEGLKVHDDIFSFIEPHGEPSWFGFPLVCNEDVDVLECIEFLESKGIATRRLFGGNLTRQPAYRKINYRSDDLIDTDRAMENGFWFGLYPAIGNEQIDYIINTFKELRRVI